MSNASAVNSSGKTDRQELKGMDTNDSEAATSGEATTGSGGDQRQQSQLQLIPEARQRVTNKILDTLKKHLPLNTPGGLDELSRIAARFEERIYTAATSQSDYLWKISLKMLAMETKHETVCIGAKRKRIMAP